MGHVVESFMGRVKAGVSSPEKRPHVGRDQSIGHATENRFALDVAQIKRASSMQINNLIIANQRANARLPRSVFERYKFHRSLPAGECSDFIERNKPCLSRRSGHPNLGSLPSWTFVSLVVKA